MSKNDTLDPFANCLRIAESSVNSFPRKMTDTPPLQNVLFDIGNVIIAFDFRRAVNRLQADCVLGPEEALSSLMPLVPELETGRMAEAEFIREASGRIGYRGTAAEFQAAFEDIFDLNEPIVALVESLRQRGLRLCLLSNTNGIHVPFFESHYPVFGHFVGRIYSHQVGVMKPDPRIFEITIERLGLEPARTLYIDDLEKNCAAGEEAGFWTHCYDRARHGDLLECLARFDL